LGASFYHQHLLMLVSFLHAVAMVHRDLEPSLAPLGQSLTVFHVSLLSLTFMPIAHGLKDDYLFNCFFSDPTALFC